MPSQINSLLYLSPTSVLPVVGWIFIIRRSVLCSIYIIGAPCHYIRPPIRTYENLSFTHQPIFLTSKNNGLYSASYIENESHLNFFVVDLPLFIRTSIARLIPVNSLDISSSTVRILQVLELFHIKWYVLSPRAWTRCKTVCTLS